MPFLFPLFPSFTLNERSFFDNVRVIVRDAVETQRPYLLAILNSSFCSKRSEELQTRRLFLCQSFAQRMLYADSFSFNTAVPP